MHKHMPILGKAFAIALLLSGCSVTAFANDGNDVSQASYLHNVRSSGAFGDSVTDAQLLDIGQSACKAARANLGDPQALAAGLADMAQGYTADKARGVGIIFGAAGRDLCPDADSTIQGAADLLSNR